MSVLFMAVCITIAGLIVDCVQADEVPVCGPSPAEEEWSAHHPEQGFKGTGLLSS